MKKQTRRQGGLGMLALSALFFCLFSLEACRKEMGAASFYAGCTENMLVQTHDTIVLGGYQWRQDYPIDMEGDGYPDFIVSALIDGSPGLGHIPVVTIETSDNASFASTLVTDTVFTDSVVHNLGYWDGYYHQDIDYYWLCSRVAETSRIQSITATEKPRVFEAGSAPLTNRFVTGKFLLYAGNTSTWYGSTAGDTLIQKQYIGYWDDCSLNVLANCYFIVKLKKQNGDKLGWIYLKVFEWGGIAVYTTGIQK
jgi:hypothetical protein